MNELTSRFEAVAVPPLSTTGQCCVKDATGRGLSFLPHADELLNIHKYTPPLRPQAETVAFITFICDINSK